MKTPSIARRRTGTAAPLLALALAACASLPAPVPHALQPATHERELMNVAATGVQIYECRAASGAAPAWAFVAPEADLFDAQGRTIGSHGAGPFWLAHDGSRVEGTLQSRADAPKPGAIPWLLLRARNTGAPGQFSRVTSIQRIHTDGGVAPADGCSTAALGQRRRVPYRADYRLFVPA